MGLRTLDVAYDPWEASVKASALDAAGIPVFIGNYQYASMNPALWLALGGLPINVPEEEFEAGRAILNAPVPEDFPAADAIDTCPNCGSTDVFQRRSLLVGVLLLMWGVFGMPVSRERYCRTCAHRWRISE